MTKKAPNNAAWNAWVTKREELVEKTGIAPQDLQILDAFFAPGGKASQQAKTHQEKTVQAVVDFAAFASDYLAGAA
mgnify:CR=1 FL=1